jgi:hypothetical protein
MNGDGGLKGYQFQEYFAKLSTVKDLFSGVYSIDTIPKQLEQKHFIICNLSPSNEPGTHWIAIIRTEKKCIEIFNSLGYKSLTSLAPYLPFKRKIKLEYNEDQFQPDLSSNCGLFCIFFIIKRILSFDVSYSALLEDIFVKNKDKNDQKVTKYCQKLLTRNSDTYF